MSKCEGFVFSERVVAICFEHMHMYTSLLDIILMHMDMHMHYPNLGRAAVMST
jgi:hypothetical protein